MKSSQLVRLQHQFLASLHRGPTDWLLEEILPAPGFTDGKQVLDIYLQRAMARTIDPLHSVYRCVSWMVGAEGLERLMENFYSQSLGEPLNSEIMAADFASFLGSLSPSDFDRLSLSILIDPNCGFSASQALMAAGVLDWRSHWVSLSNRDQKPPTEQMHKKLRQRTFAGFRPQLDSSTRLCLSGIDLVAMRQLADSETTGQTVPACPNQPGTFLIHEDLNYNLRVRLLSEIEARLLNQCDGTHSIASLCHEASFFGSSTNDTHTLISKLIDEGVITALLDGLTEN
tara:strand:- start:4117 stop:4974 length:858 start_codon:yes stop_codon:yes gene_type:complete